MARVHGAHIAAEQITHRYRHAKTDVLEEITLTIEPGEAVALIGRSGCGKSTLLHIIAGLMKPAAGKIYIDGRVVEAPSPDWVMMFQQPSLFPWMTVAQNVELGLRFTGRRAEAKRRVPELLELVELADFADRNVQDLSGGQQQRVALARSLAPRPEVLLLDEPFSALDAFTRASLQRDVRRIARDLGITLLLVTHDISEATVMAERAMVMAGSPGRIRAEIPVKLCEEDRLRGGPAFNETRARLQKEFETIAGIDGDEPSAEPSHSYSRPQSTFTTKTEVHRSEGALAV